LKLKANSLPFDLAYINASISSVNKLSRLTHKDPGLITARAKAVVAIRATNAASAAPMETGCDDS
jgi:hypothetical protein